MKKTEKESKEIQTVDVTRGEIRYCLLGTTPLIPRTMSQKAMQELLMPSKPKTRAERSLTYKHDPHAEFRESAILLSRDDEPTLLAMPGGAFKKAMASATMDAGGSSKAQVGRLTYVGPYNIGIYGEPQMLMSIVRNADMNRTPDVRTRVIMPNWCCEIVVRYARPMLNERTVTSLLANAGIYIGIGDWRQEKGSGSMGLWELVEEDNKAFLAIKSKWGRASQMRAMKEPVPFDEETETLISWFDSEVKRRSDVPKGKKASKKEVR